MWNSVDVEIVRDVTLDAIGPFENADAEDGIMLNHAYFDMRGYSLADAEAVVREEGDFLRDLEAAEDDEDEVEAMLDSLVADFSELGGFDVGTAGTIYALSAAGAAPITSCNGGLLGGSHSSNVPHVLFSIDPLKFAPILKAAEIADVGLLNNDGHVEIFATTIPHLHLFAQSLVRVLAEQSTSSA